eukprot:tig00001056_g6627.t1
MQPGGAGVAYGGGAYGQPDYGQSYQGGGYVHDSPIAGVPSGPYGAAVPGIPAQNFGQGIYAQQYGAGGPGLPPAPSYGPGTPASSAHSLGPAAPPSPYYAQPAAATPAIAVGVPADPDVKLQRDPRERFRPAGAYNDVFWTFAFLACQVVTVGLAIGYGREISFGGIKMPGSDSDGATARGWVVGIVVALASAVLFTYIAFQLIKRFPLHFVKAGLWFSVCLVGVCMIVAFCLGQTALGIGFAIAFAFQLVYIWIAQSRIAFAAANLQVVAEFLHDPRFNAMHLVTAAVVLVQAAYFAFWAFTLYAVTYAHGGTGYGSLWAVFLTFDLYWSLQVIANVLHVTVSGVFATWYFFPDSSFPPNPTAAAFKRTMGPAFGSVCLGSLIVAVIQTLRALARKNADDREESIGAAICRCIVQCILSILESLFRYVNKYAYARIAIYGIPYWQAAKETYHLLMTSAFEMLVNDDMIGGVCFLTAFIVGALTFFIGGFSGWATATGTSFGAVGALAFVVGLLVCFTAFRLVESCVATLFVAFAEAPQALAFSRPQVYAVLQSAWCGRYAGMQQFFGPSHYA